MSGTISRLGICLIADVIKKIEILQNNALYLVILNSELYWNFACSVMLQISLIIKKIVKFYNAIFFKKKAFLQFYSQTTCWVTNSFGIFIILQFWKNLLQIAWRKLQII